MKLSLCSANYGKADLRKIIHRASELGFDGIELTVTFHAPTTLDPEARTTISNWLQDASLECSGLHFIFDEKVKLASTSREDVRYTIEYTEGVVDLAQSLGAKTIIVGGGGSRTIKEGQDRAAISNELTKVFSTVGGYAKEKGVAVAIEALNRYETNFINTLMEAAEFVEKIGLQNVGIMGDTFHMNIEESSIEDAILAYGDQLAHVHFCGF
jgi:sugar phosphate isomerase/epimerase